MIATIDLFAQIKNAVLDLQGAQLQTYERPLKALAKLLDHPDLATINAHLTEGLDLDDFIAHADPGGSFVGSAKLNWPESEREAVGISLLLIKRFAQSPNFMLNFGHTYCYSGNKLIGDIRAVVSQIIIPFSRDYRGYVEAKGAPVVKLVPPMSNKIFIVHGHDGEAREAVARLLERLGLEPIILHEQANRGRTIIEKVEANSDVGFAVILLTPDDEGRALGGMLEPRVRQNVLLELGYFIGHLGRHKVCALKRGQVEIPSDFAGVVWEAMDSGDGWKQALGRELKAAGYTVDWNKVME